MRVTAIVLMMVFHIVYDLYVFAGINIDYRTLPWVFIGKAAALIFIFISGLASGFSKSPVKRGGKVLFWGMVVTAVTYLLFPEEYIRFGILHFLALTMMMYPLLNKMPSPVLAGVAVLSAGLGFWAEKQVVATNLLLPLGFKYAGFYTMDYFPLLPYMAVTILGILTYRHIYAGRKEALFPSFQGKQAGWKLTEWLSRNSLGVYLLHQPVLLLIIFSVIRAKDALSIG